MIRRRFPIPITLAALLLGALACNVNFTAQEAAPEDIQSRPLVRLLAPANDSVYAEGAKVEFYAIAQDSLAGVARIEFRLDDTLILGEVRAPNPEPSFAARMVWTAEGQQAHQLIVEAFRPDNSSLGESAVVLTVIDQPGAGNVQSAPPAATPDTSPAPTTSPGESTDTIATAVPTPTPRSQDIGIISGPTARVMVDELFVRQGPGTTYAPVGVLQLDDIVKIAGRNTDNTWWAVEYGEGIAWVVASQVSVQGDVTNLPLVAPP